MKNTLWQASICAAIALASTTASLAGSQPSPQTQPAIDRHALVTRHGVTLTKADPQTELQVGNGEFAFGFDVTGLQTFYGNSMSQWGWHSFPLPAGKTPADLKLEQFDTHGRKVGYATSPKGQQQLYAWLRANPHRLNLGRLRLRFDKPLAPNDLKGVNQKLDLWSGLVTSEYQLDGQPVRVETCADPARDAIAVRIASPLVSSGRLSVELAFPYGGSGSSGANWDHPEAHKTVMHRTGNRADFARTLDSDSYWATLAWGGTADLTQLSQHEYRLSAGKEPTLEFVCAFASVADQSPMPTVADVQAASGTHWPAFWNSGGAVDLSGSRDPRWNELERRIVLSQYLLAVNEAGSLPPQESGLFENGWNGKFHLEMHWWHGVHYALWNRWPMFDRSLGWYQKTLPAARQLAQSQGYRGARWPKMVGPEGRDSPSGTGPLLAWQQPHPIYYAELDYRLHPTREVLEKWREVVFSTADFLASFSVFDPAEGKFVLGPPMKTIPENTNPRDTRNPTFELSYFRFGLRTAQQWRARLGLSPEPQWTKVLNALAPLSMADGLYLAQEGMTDTFTKNNYEHPSMIGALGMLPGDGVDPNVMRATVRRVASIWQWDRCWGWDFPMMAMAAARSNEPKLAIDALLSKSPKNNFNEIGLSSGGPFPYFPSNGALLTAVAMMAAGWDGCPEAPAPGFPSDGSWVVKWEGLNKLP